MAVRSFDLLKSEYAALWAACTIKPANKNEVFKFANEIRANRPIYDEISKRTNGVPWYVIGIMHAMECSQFPRTTQHLHNGDSLKKRTWQVPANRPPVWPPADGTNPFVESAVDALTMKGKEFDKIKDWTIERVAYVLETYNGWGYRGKGVNSAYLWSYTNNYTRGKYVRDHVWSDTVVSDQCGGMALLKALIEIDPVSIDQHPPDAENPPPAWPKAEVPAQPYMAVAASSTSVRLKILSMLTVVGTWLESVFNWIPEIHTEADSVLAPLTALSKSLKLNIGGVAVAVVLVAGVIVILRHTKDKAELKTLKGE
jgi:lysozyme family protein